MAGVMLATGVGGEAMGAPREHDSTGARTEAVETVEYSPEVKRFAKAYGMSMEDAVSMNDALSDVFTGSAADRTSGYAKVRFYLSIADTPPFLQGLMASEMLNRTPPGTDIDLGGRAHYVHTTDGSIVSIEGGKEVVLFNGGDEEEDGLVVMEAMSTSGPEYFTADEVEVEEPEEVVKKVERKDGDPVTMADVLDAMEDPGQMTTVLLEMRSAYSNDAEFNLGLRNAMVHISLLTAVNELEANFGSYVVDGEGALWVHAPDKDPVRVVGAR